MIVGDRLMVDLIGSDDWLNLIGVWNIFGNSCSYVMIQVVVLIDLIIVKNEGLFDVVEMILFENMIVQLLLNKLVVFGLFYLVCEIIEVVCIVFSQVVFEWLCFQGYKMGMFNVLIGFDVDGWMWMDQGVDVCVEDVLVVQGIDGWGGFCIVFGNLLLLQVEDVESCFLVVNFGCQMVIDKGGVGQWCG